MASILLIGNFRPALPLARRLAELGHAVYCGVDRPGIRLYASRRVSGFFLHAPIDAEPDAAMADVAAWLAGRPEVDVLIPVSEAATTAVSRWRDRLPGGLRLVLPAAEVVELCADKAAMFALCDEVGVPLADRRVVADFEALVAALLQLGAPAVIKPVDSPLPLLGAKAVLFRPGDDPRAVVPAWPEEHPHLCVQRYVRGPRHNVVFAAKEGALVAAVEFRSVRTDRVDGTGFSTHVVSVAPTPSVRLASERLARRLTYTGVGMFQFMLDEGTGELCFLELNPRLGGTSAAAEMCGVPIFCLMLKLALDEALPAPPDPWTYVGDRHVVWTSGDLAGVVAEWRRGALGVRGAAAWGLAALRDAFRPHHLTFAISDPGPTLSRYGGRLFGRARPPHATEERHTSLRPRRLAPRFRKAS